MSVIFQNTSSVHTIFWDLNACDELSMNHSFEMILDSVELMTLILIGQHSKALATSQNTV